MTSCLPLRRTSVQMHLSPKVSISAAEIQTLGGLVSGKSESFSGLETSGKRTCRNCSTGRERRVRERNPIGTKFGVPPFLHQNGKLTFRKLRHCVQILGKQRELQEMGEICLSNLFKVGFLSISHSQHQEDAAALAKLLRKIIFLH